MWRVLISIFFSMVLFTGNQSYAGPLEELQGEQRPLLLFAKSRSDASLDKQIDLLRGRRSDMRERNMVVLRTAGNEETRAAIGYVSLPAGSAYQLRKRFQPRRSGLTAILVGKDGTEKARWERVVQPDEIFELIDSMPMRRKEISGASSTVTN